jgi:hypothetical protein
VDPKGTGGDLWGNWSPQIFGRDQALFPRSRAGLGVWDPRVGTRMIATRERRNPSSSQPVTFGGFTIVPTIAMEVAVPASRAFWKGYLKLSFVSCPVALYPATSAAERVSFRQVNRRTGTNSWIPSLEREWIRQTKRGATRLAKMSFC